MNPALARPLTPMSKMQQRVPLMRSAVLQNNWVRHQEKKPRIQANAEARSTKRKGTTKFWDDAKAAAFCASLLSACRNQQGPGHGPDVQVAVRFVASLHEVDKNILRKAARALVWEVPPDRQQRDRGERDLPHASPASAARMKDLDAIAVAWDELFRSRRKVQPEDTFPITDTDART